MVLSAALTALLGMSSIATACSAHSRQMRCWNTTIPKRSLDARDLQSRWFGIDDPAAGTVHPWPQTCSDPVVQPLRYCWANPRSAKNLRPVLDEAIKRWTPAWSDGTNRLSSLQIVLDPGCHGNPDCQCGELDVSNDALMISDETKEGDSGWNDGPDCQTVTTTGYQHTVDNEPDRPFRHYLKFCHYEPTDNTRSFPKAVLAMLHEIGHAIGFGHEHQRPDRDQYLYYKSRNLLGYDQALQAVNIDEQAFFDDDESDDRRIRQAARLGQIAQYYFPNAVDYTRADHSTDVSESFAASAKFDYDSIMMYSSSTGANAQGKKVIWRKDNGQEVWMGGDPDPEKAGISEGDVARVAQLYDARTGAGERAKMGDVWGKGAGPSKLKVRLLSGEESVVVTPKGRREARERERSEL